MAFWTMRITRSKNNIIFGHSGGMSNGATWYSKTVTKPELFHYSRAQLFES